MRLVKNILLTAFLGLGLALASCENVASDEETQIPYFSPVV